MGTGDAIKIWADLWLPSIDEPFISSPLDVDFCDAPVDNHELWKKVWGMAIQNKCKNAPEDVLHALWSCPHLSTVWDRNPDWNFKENTHFQDFSELVQHEIQSSGHLEFFAQTIWTIWYKRNLLRTNGKPFPINQLLLNVGAALDGFVPPIPPKPPNQVACIPQTVKWRPPPSSFLKVNFDGAVFQDEVVAGVGVIIQDEKGQVIGFTARKIPLTLSIAAIEAFAAITTLKFAHDFGLSSLILEGDSEVVINALKSEEDSLVKFSHLIEEGKSIANSFNVVQFCHVKREGNLVAHNIAKHARHVSEFSV
nr:uncharacterized protein LOC112025826 [Quercus suber]